MQATLTENSLAILNKRYLDGDTVDQLWDRVSGGNPDYRRLLSELRFMPNSPTLFNAGRNNGCTLSACFVFDIQDSMHGKGSICETRNKAIAVAKAGGGVGYYGSLLRPRNSPIKSIHRKACGPVAVIRDYHGISQLITQGGKRELAQMFVLDCDHADIQEFIHCKDDDPQALSSFNISVGWKKDWVDQVQWDGIKLIKANSLNDHCENLEKSPFVATKLWLEQCKSAHAHGCPGMFFPDTVNEHNPNRHLGLMRAPNPCGETPNRSDEPCNLGSLNLICYYDPATRGILWADLERDAYLATCFLDDILDRNVFPHPDITGAALLTRKLGLGVMGWADLLGLLHIHYDTDQAVTLADELMRRIAAANLEARIDMAKEKGPYKGHSDRTNGPYLRNETGTSIAPTGTIALIVGLDDSQSIEPHFVGIKGKAHRTTAEGMRLQVNNHDKFDGFVPHTAHEIHWSWHVKHQAAFQKHTDLGVSKTINLPNSATVQDVSDAYKLMYDLGCKGGTVFRDGCRAEQVIVKEGKTRSVYLMGVDRAEPPARHRKLPDDVPQIPRHKFRIAGRKGFIHMGVFPDDFPQAGQLCEVFVTLENMGSTMDGMLDAWSKMTSNALQRGVPLEKIVRLHKNSRYEPCGLTSNKEIPHCSSLLDYVVRFLELKLLKTASDSQPSSNGSYAKSGCFCPDCGAETVLKSGCQVCVTDGCGYSKCS